MVLGEVDRGWEVSRNTLTAERVSIGSSEPGFLATLDGFVEFVKDGQFDQIAQNRAGQLIAEGHAAKLLNMRSTLLTLAGGDADAVGRDLEAAVDAHRSGLRGVRGVVVRHRRRRSATRRRCRASGPNGCWLAAPRRSTAAPPRCSSTSSPSGCSDCPAIRKSGRTVEVCRKFTGAASRSACSCAPPRRRVASSGRSSWPLRPRRWRRPASTASYR